MNICWNRARDSIAPNDKYFTRHTLRQTAVLRIVNFKFNTKHIATYLRLSSTRIAERYINIDANQCPRMFETLEEALA